ncbi:MAG: class I SAM-dependent methyltransferase [Promethearchaeota archaeon]|nr:MAG: class I SAM-dependent methyltransferase [Candidatus Lokiarchaeota archaeon]
MNEISELVAKGYNKIAKDYYSHRDLNKFNSELEKFSSLLPKKALVLDVGSGAGIPTAKFLTKKGFNVQGIDLSEKMLSLARENVPDAKFAKMDINEIKFEENTFDGIISVYTLFHIPKKSHLSIFKKLFEILKPGGILLINSGISDSEGISNFFGVPMFWSNYNPQTTLELVKKAGFSIISEGVLERGGEYQYWIYAKKNQISSDLSSR